MCKQKRLKGQKVVHGESESSEGSGDSQGQSGGEKNGSGQDNQGNDSPQRQSKMIANNILNSQRGEVDWNKMKQMAENLYSSWAVIELDLHALNVKPEEILQFSNDLKASVMQIEKEDKTNSLITLANSYATLARVIDEYETNTMTKQVSYTKANINQVVNDVSIGVNQQAEINKVYVLLKEMQESVKLQDISLFYINYKNGMQTLDSIG